MASLVTRQVKSYLQGDSPTMQLATVNGGMPWIATVYFVADDELNVYWLSWPERRHSQELTGDAHVAITVVVKASRPVIGVQLEGEAREVTDRRVVQRVMKRYVAKYGEGERYHDAFVAGTNKHRLYYMTPRMGQLFDEVNYPGSSPIMLSFIGSDASGGVV